MDDLNKKGQRPGLDAAVSLAQARKLAGQAIEVMGVDIGKDAADAAREGPLGTLNVQELQEFAQELVGEGMAEFEGNAICLDNAEVGREGYGHERERTPGSESHRRGAD